MRPNIFVGLSDGNAVYKKWYYEVSIDQIENASPRPFKFRVGWANTNGFTPSPRGGEGWCSVGVGDDLSSYGFDGMNLWTGGEIFFSFFFFSKFLIFTSHLIIHIFRWSHLVFVMTKTYV